MLENVFKVYNKELAYLYSNLILNKLSFLKSHNVVSVNLCYQHALPQIS